MEIKNLSEIQASSIESVLCDMKTANPELWWRTYHQSEVVTPPNDNELLRKIEVLENKMDSLMQILKNIFGDHVLFDGRFVDLKK